MKSAWALHRVTRRLDSGRHGEWDRTVLFRVLVLVRPMLSSRQIFSLSEPSSETRVEHAVVVLELTTDQT